MQPTSGYPRALVCCALFACACAARAQVGADVIWVPSPPVTVDAMLKLARVGPGDYLIDLGCGDGRIVIAAAKKGARGLGVDVDPELLKVAREAAAKAGVAERAKFTERNFFEQDLSRASVVALYLLPEINLRLRPQLLAQLRPGTRVVAHDAHMGDWFPDRTLTVEAPDKTVGTPGVSQLYLWIIPAPVAGRWDVMLAGPGTAAELTLVQRYQQIGGTWKEGGVTRPIANAQIEGDRLEFDVPGDGTPAGQARHFNARVAGEGLSGGYGAAEGRTAQRWVAMRVTKPRDAR